MNAEEMLADIDTLLSEMWETYAVRPATVWFNVGAYRALMRRLDGFRPRAIRRGPRGRRLALKRR